MATVLLHTVKGSAVDHADVCTLCLWQGVWFNDVPRIFTLFHGLVTGDDDCGLVTFNPPTIKGSCKNGEVGHSLRVTPFQSQPSSHSCWGHACTHRTH